MKKKGETEIAKTLHKRKQALVDAVKRVRDGAVNVWITLDGRRVNLKKYEPVEGSFEALIKRGGRIKLALITQKDGLKAHLTRKSVYIREKDILCIVSSSFLRSNGPIAPMAERSQ